MVRTHGSGVPRVKSRLKHQVGYGTLEDRAAGPDEVAVERAIKKGNIRLRPVELREAIRRLLVEGVSGRQIAIRLGCCDRTVYRHKKALGYHDQEPV